MSLFRTALAVSVVALFTIACCGGGGGGSDPAPAGVPTPTRDTTPPTVTSRSPAAAATGVATTSTINATFSEAVTGASSASMTVSAGDTPVVGAVATTVSTATFTPASGLYCTATHTVALTSGIKDVAGNALVPTSWTFTTKPFATPWTFIGNTGATGLNRPVPVAPPAPPPAPDAGLASDPHMVALGNKLYAIWSQKNIGGFEQVHVSVYDTTSAAPAWTVVDGGNGGILNKTPGQPGLNPQLAVLGTKLYAIWSEFNGATGTRLPTNQIRVAEYNDVTDRWTFIDGNALLDGINRTPTHSAGSPQLMPFNNKLYAIWTETNGPPPVPPADPVINKVRVAVYNNPGWSAVAPSLTTGLNRALVSDAFDPSLGVFNGKLYATWNEIAGSETAGFRHLLYVSVYNGTNAWEPADGNNPTGLIGLNRDPIFNANSSRLVVFGGKLYLIWPEDYLNTDPPPAGAPQGFKIRAAVYNNLLGTQAKWDFVDGGQPIGLNKTLGSTGTRPQAAVYGDKLYVSWQEGPASGPGASQIRVKAYNGSTWAFVDGDGLSGINKVAANNATAPQLTVLGTKLYSTWSESNGATVPINQIRVAAAGCQ